MANFLSRAFGKSKAAQPELGESTPQQTRGGTTRLPSMLSMLLADGSTDGTGRVSPGTFETYRKMRRNPTIALARQIATMPCRTGKWTVENDDDAPDDAHDHIEAVANRLWPSWINWACQSLDFGFQSWEVIWESGPDGRFQPARFKPLLPDKTEILVDKEHGNYGGLKQDDIILPPEKTVLYTYDEDAGNLYGRSRNENCRETAWSQWVTTLERLAEYTKRVAGAVPMVEYPEGQSTDESGASWPHYVLAQRIIQNLTHAKGVVMPGVWKNNPDLSAFIRAGGDLSKLKAWAISFLESKDQHGAEFIEIEKYMDQLLMRGWLVPERGAIEASQGGSRADSKTHGDISTGIAEVVFEDMIRAWNEQVVDRCLTYNFGKAAAGKVRLKRVEMDPDKVAFYQDFVKQLLVAPANIDIALKTVDFNVLLDEAGLPKLEETIPQPEPGDVIPAPARGPGDVPPGHMSMAKAIYARAFGGEGNPNHDPATGQFTEGTGGGKAAPPIGSTIWITSPNSDKDYPYTVLIVNDDGSVYAKSHTTGEHKTLKKGQWRTPQQQTDKMMISEAR